MTRRQFTIAATFLSLALTMACNGKHATTIQNDEGPPAGANAPLVSSLNMSGASAKDQLISGFWGLENGAWRWTAGKFSVTLKTPLGAAQKGATLTLRADCFRRRPEAGTLPNAHRLCRQGRSEIRKIRRCRRSYLHR